MQGVYECVKRLRLFSVGSCISQIWTLAWHFYFFFYIPGAPKMEEPQASPLLWEAPCPCLLPRGQPQLDVVSLTTASPGDGDKDIQG